MQGLSQKNTMEIKIQLPNADDMTVEKWFSQMRNVLKSAEKMYQEELKDLTEEEIESLKTDKTIWVRLSFSESVVNAALEKDYHEIDEDVNSQLYLTIASL